MKLYVLGPFRVSRDGADLPASTWRRKRAVDLLTALALAPGHSIAKEELIGGFWPGKEPSRGANNLHRALHDVRKALGGPLVGIERGRVQLDPSIWVDVAAFEEGASDDDPEALQLYEAHPDTELEALFPRTDALRSLFVDGSLRAARRHLTTDPDTALGILRRLLVLEPSSEEAHRLAMRALGESGRIAEALAQYEQCEAALKETRGVEPSASTRSLLTSLKERRSTAPSQVGSRLGTLSRMLLGTSNPGRPRGRAAELDAIAEFVREGSGLLLLAGAAGIGKTRMAVEAARCADERGALLLSGAGLDYEGMPPFAPFIEAFASHDRATGAGDNPFLAFRPSGSVQDDTLRLYQSVHQTLVSLGAGGPVFLLLDDLHQADGSSLHLLHYLARASRTANLILVATCRSEGLTIGTRLHSVVTGLHRERLVTRVDLAPMDRATTAALVQDLLGEPAPDELVDQIHALAEGNAFYIEELVHAWSDSGSVSMPRELQAAVLERVHRVGSDAECLLRAASALGQHFELDLAAEVAQVGDVAAVDALELCIEADLVRDDGDRYRFRHALVREAVYQSVTSARRRLLHRRCAEAMEGSRWSRLPDRIERLARHHRLAGSVDKAVPYLIEAARKAREKTGLREAVAFYTEALDLLERDPIGPTTFQVLLGLGQSQLLLSELGAAVQSLDRAAALRGAEWTPEPADRGRALRLSGLALITSGHLDEAETRIQGALDALADSGDSEQLADTHYYLAQLRWHQNRHSEAYSVAESCLRYAEDTKNPKIIAKGYEMLALACHSLGAWHEGEGYEDQRQQLVGGPVDVAQAFDVHL